jgi:hypothetical protein
VSTEREAELLELLLRRGPDADVLARARRDPEDGPLLADLETFVERMRADDARRGDPADWSPVREGALVGRVLARTTREDLSWRGELRLLAGFVRERLSASPVLRIVAASLALHLAAVPVVGWYVARERAEHAIHTGIERPAEDAFAHLPDETVVPRFPEAPSAADLDAYSLSATENALRRARFVLSTRVGAPLETPAGAPSLERNLLVARSRLLAERVWTTWLDDEEAWRGAGPLARILWAELVLDRLALTGTRAPLAGAVLNALALDLEAPGGPRLEPARADLARTTLRRARAYGAWEAGAELDPEPPPLPLGGEWFDLLERAAVGTPLADTPELERFRARARR